MKDEDKKGEALRQQRFQMLEHIAEELSGEIVFPSHFDATLKIRNALRDSERSADTLIALIHTEPLLCARIIHEANAKIARKAQSVATEDVPQPAERRVGSVRAAIDVLGVSATRNLCLGIATAQLVRCKELVVFQDVSKVLWEHSLYAAVAAEAISRHLTRIDPEEAFFAGLVHDLGAFYMLYRSAQYSELRLRPDTVKHVVAQWHESIGESLLASLQLPDSVVSGVSHHDEPRAPLTRDPRNLGEVVYAANAIAQVHCEWLEATPAHRELGEQYHALVPEIQARYKKMMKP